jgi:hypothetical protein
MFERHPIIRRHRASEPDCGQSLEPFWRTLGEAISWCEPRVDLANPQGCLRDASIAPATLERSYFSAAGSVFSHRRHRARAVKVQSWLAGGRLLVYFPDAQLADGAAEAESDGFFDIHDAPPWGTWVAMIEDDSGQDDCTSVYLVAWVPPAFLEHAHRGIQVNPEECIAWLDTTSVWLNRALR